MSKSADDTNDDDKNIVKSKFQLSIDNPTMMEIYPFGGVLSYMKYHYLDGIMKQNLMLVDKTRYIYKNKDKVSVAKNPKSEEETKSLTSKYLSDMDRVKNEIGD